MALCHIPDTSFILGVLMAISSLGVGSGLDLNSLVEGLLSAERTPVEQRLNGRQEDLEAELSAFGTLAGGVSGLESSLQKLTNLSTGRTASSANSEALSVTADDDADVSSYSVSVNQLASGQSLAINPSTPYLSSTDVIGTGTLTFTTMNPDKSSVSITIDSSNNTMEGIRDAINDSDFNVNAVIVNDGTGYRLLLSTEDTGVMNALEVTVTDADGNNTDNSGLSQLAFNGSASNMVETVAASDAEITVNGLDIASSTNSFNEFLPGLTLTAKEVTAESFGVTVAFDKGSATSAIRGFVDAYNNLKDSMGALTTYNPETGFAGPLNGDGLVRGLESTLFNSIISEYGEEGSAFQSLVNLGISTDAEGKLTIDQDALNTAIDDDYSGFVAFANALGETMNTTVADRYLGSGGLINNRQENLRSGLDQIGEERDKLEIRLEALEARLVKQYSALDTLLAGLQQTSNFISTQLATLDFSPKSNS
jgi:flagellar hook-associated protein 2